MREKWIFSRGAAIVFGLLLVVLLTAIPAAAITGNISEGDSGQAAINTSGTDDLGGLSTDLPVADFSADVTNGTAPLTVQFTDNSTGAEGWSWGFGDGANSTEQNPAHTYDTAGTYTVNLTVTNGDGSNFGMKAGYISVSAAEGTTNETFQADADTYVRLGGGCEDNNYGTSSTLYIREIDDPLGSSSGKLYRSLIHFNLSSIPEGATIESAILSGYQSARLGDREVGAYHVTDTWNESGAWDEASNSSVPATWHNGVTWNTQPSTLDQPTDVTDPGSAANVWVNWDVTQDVQAYVNGAANYGWMLKFTNESATSTEQKVQLKSCSSTDATQKPYLNVVYSTSGSTGGNVPIADFSVNVTKGVAPLTVQFTDASTNSPSSWAWDFENDGTIDSIAQNPTHTYTAAGNYTVTLNVANADGSDSMVKTDYIAVTGNVSGSVVLSFSPDPASAGVGGTTEVSIVVDSLPAGLSGYNLTVSLDDPAVANITAVDVPTWASINATGTLPSGSVWIKAADLSEAISAGAENVTLATLTLTGISAGTANITAVVTGMDGDDGSAIEANVTDGQVLVSTAATIPGCENPPHDLDGDGICDDVNGNGLFDFDDVVTFFTSIEWVAQNEPVETLDVNGNGRIDYADLVGLYQKL